MRSLIGASDPLRRKGGWYVGEPPDIGVMCPLEARLVDLVIGDPLQDFLEDDTGLEARQGRTQAGMHAEPEGHMVARAAADVENIRVLELVRITIGGDDAQAYAIPLL